MGKDEAKLNDASLRATHAETERPCRTSRRERIAELSSIDVQNRH